MFYQAVNKILGLGNGKIWEDVRRELTSDQVAEIHKVFAALWPIDTNIVDLLPRSDSRVLRAVYVGMVDPRVIPVSVIAWLTYFDEIILPSPFMNARNIRPAYSPVESPAQHKQQTLMNVALLLQLTPFIAAGKVHLIPDPLDFSYFMRDSFWSIAKEKSIKLKIGEGDLGTARALGEDSFTRSLYSLPDEALRGKIRQVDPEISDEMLDGCVAHARKQQLEDHYALLQPLGSEGDGGSFQQMRSISFELAMFLAQLTGSTIYSEQALTARELNESRNPSTGGVIQDYECTTSFPIHLFGPVDAWMTHIERFEEVRAKLRQVWQATLVQQDRRDAGAVISGMDEVLRVVETVGKPQPTEGLLQSFETTVRISIPANGYGLNEVRRFLISFGRAGALEVVPVSFFFGRSAERNS